MKKEVFNEWLKKRNFVEYTVDNRILEDIETIMNDEYEEIALPMIKRYLNVLKGEDEYDPTT